MQSDFFGVLECLGIQFSGPFTVGVQKRKKGFKKKFKLFFTNYIYMK
jgi:hypothetical protein